MTIRRAAVIGWPIAHSRSPLIHGYWLKRYAIPGEYVRQAVAPEDVGRFLGDLPGQGLVGCNVTQPHKEAAFAAVRIADEATRRLKVVNTVFQRDGEACGTSTDGEGFLANLRQELGGWSSANRRAVMLGAGGAARAIAGALIDDGFAELAVVNRDARRAEALRNDFGAIVKPAGWRSAPDAVADADLVINATSLGMAGHPALDLDLGRLPASAVVADIVYVPLETALLAAARQRGNRTVPGLGMLLHQAVRGFELWFGTRPEVTPALYRLLTSDLARAA